MVMTIDIPDAAVKEAESRGIQVEELLREKFTTHVEERILPGSRPFGNGTRTPAEAGASICKNRKRYTLGDITIRELIDEGRRYP